MDGSQGSESLLRVLIGGLRDKIQINSFNVAG